MRKYFTWRCIGLHVLTLVLVPAFLLAGWWQYHVALGGNDLSWVYTVEWPFFAVYGVYIWWRLIHDESTPFDRLWIARQRAAADETGTPLHQIPGWATDKALSREVVKASIEAARLPALAHARRSALESRGHTLAREWTSAEPHEAEKLPVVRAQSDPGGGEPELDDPDGSVIEARVLEVKTVVDEELEAYNSYLFELSWRDPPKRWGSPGHRRRGQARGTGDEPADPPPSGAPPHPALPAGSTAAAHEPEAESEDGTT